MSSERAIEQKEMRIPYGIYVHDFDGRFITASESFLAILGRDASDLRDGLTIPDVLADPDSIALAFAEIEAQKTGQKDGAGPYLLRARRRDNSVFEVMIKSYKTEHERRDVIKGIALVTSPTATLEKALDRAEYGYYCSADGRTLWATGFERRLFGIDTWGRPRAWLYVFDGEREVFLGELEDAVRRHARDPEEEAEELRDYVILCKGSRPGERVFVSTRTWLVRDHEGKRLAIEGIYRDVSGSYESPDQGVIVARRQQIVHLNQVFLGKMGLTRDEAIDSRLDALLAGHGLDSLLRGKGAECILHPLCDPKHRVLTDVSVERLNPQNDLYLVYRFHFPAGGLDRLINEQIYKSVVEGGRDGCAIFNENFRLVRANDRFCEIFDAGPETYVEGRLAGDFHPEASYQRVEPLLRGCLAAEDSTNEEPVAVEGRRSGGSEFPVEMSVHPIAVPGERLALCAYHDLSPRQKLEATLEAERNLTSAAQRLLEQDANVKEALDWLALELEELLGAGGLALYSYDRVGEKLALQATRGELASAELLQVWPGSRLCEPCPGPSGRDKAGACVPCRGERCRLAEALGFGPGRAVAQFPLTLSGAVLSVLAVVLPPGRSVPSASTAAWQSFAAAITRVIRHAAINEGIALNRKLVEGARRTLRPTPVDEYRAILRTLFEHWNLERGCILVTRDQGATYIVAAHLAPGRTEPHPVLDAASSGIFGALQASPQRRIFYLDEASLFAEDLPFLANPQPVGHLVRKLRGAGGDLGLLILQAAPSARRPGTNLLGPVDWLVLNQALATIENTVERFELQRREMNTYQTMAHTLKVPLQYIASSFGVVNRAHKQGELGGYAVRDALGRLQSGVSVASAHVRGGEIFSQIERGQLKMTRVARLLVNREVADTVKILAPVALAEGKPPLRYEDDGWDYEHYGNAEALSIVLHALLDNAIKYSFRERESTPAGAQERILIRVFEPPDTKRKVAVSVENYGAGILEDEFEKVLERFYRGRWRDPGVHRPGAGLGLFIANRLADFLGGDLKVWATPKPGAEYADLPRAQQAHVVRVTLTLPRKRKRKREFDHAYPSR